MRLCNECFDRIPYNASDVCGRCVWEAEMEYKIEKMQNTLINIKKIVCEAIEKFAKNTAPKGKQEACSECSGYTCDYNNCPECQEEE